MQCACIKQSLSTQASISLAGVAPPAGNSTQRRGWINAVTSKGIKTQDVTAVTLRRLNLLDLDDDAEDSRVLQRWRIRVVGPPIEQQVYECTMDQEL